MGVPIFAVLGGLAMLILHYNYGTIQTVANEAFTITEKYEYATIPLFALTGYILAEGGAPKRLVGYSITGSVGCRVELQSRLH
jgi:hypothetical protein